MKFIAETNDVQYGFPDHSDIEDMAFLLADVFSRYELMAVAAGQTFEEVREMVRLFGPQVIEEGLSIVARAEPSGKMIGAALTRDFASRMPAGLEEASPHFGPVAALLDGLDDHYRQINEVVPGRIMHLFMGGVSPDYGGKGIAQAMLGLTLETGISKGYNRAVSEATGSVSQHILRNSGFVELFRTTYAEFIYQGKHIFGTIGGHEAVMLMERRF